MLMGAFSQFNSAYLSILYTASIVRQIYIYGNDSGCSLSLVSLPQIFHLSFLDLSYLAIPWHAHSLFPVGVQFLQLNNEQSASS